MNLKEAKVLMFDLDGTIIQNGCFVDNLVIKTLTILKEKGYKLCVNSGRPHFLTLKVLDLYDITGLFDYIFGCNGAEFIDVKKDEYELISYLDKDIIKEVSETFIDEPIAISILTPKLVYMNKLIDKDFIERYKKSRQLDVEIVDFSTLDMTTPKLLGMIDKDGYLSIQEKIKMINSDKYDLFFSNTHLLEIVPKDISKGKACSILKEKLKLNKNDIISFGDEENDIPMFKESIGVAMGNANDHVKKYAQYETDDVAEEGIYYFFKKYGFI